MKKDRHALILDLIKKYDIGSQEELLKRLIDCGTNITQATVSRDIKELKLVKQPIDGGRYRYTEAPIIAPDGSKLYSIFARSVTYIDYSMNICVIKCSSGMAAAVCASLDELSIKDVLGTIAGDDTIFVLCKSEKSAKNIKNILESLLLERGS